MTRLGINFTFRALKKVNSFVDHKTMILWGNCNCLASMALSMTVTRRTYSEGPHRP